MWWMSGVVDVWCDQCAILHTVWWISDMVDVWFGGCPFLHMVGWVSGVVDVSMVDVIRSQKAIFANLYVQRIPKVSLSNNAEPL